MDPSSFVLLFSEFYKILLTIFPSSKSRLLRKALLFHVAFHFPILHHSNLRRTTNVYLDHTSTHMNKNPDISTLQVAGIYQSHALFRRGILLCIFLQTPISFFLCRLVCHPPSFHCSNFRCPTR